MATTLTTRTPHKTLPIIFLLLLFLITLFLFNKQTLNPHLTIYTTTDPYTPLSIPHSNNKPSIIETNSTDLELINNDSVLKTPTGFVESEPVEQNPAGEINLNVSDSVKDDGLILETESTDLELINNHSVLKTPTGFVESKPVEQNPVGEFNLNESDSVKDDSLIVKESGVFDDEWVKKSVDWGRGCNMYAGKWVRDDGYPVYKPGSCPFVDEAFDCQSNGRVDDGYMKWRWQPDQCELRRFNATDFLVKLRGKRLMLVGDSMNRNQYESLLCMLYESLPNKSKMYEIHGYKITKGRGYFVFKFEDYNCTVEFVRSHFLVREGTRVNGQGNSNPTLAIDVIDKSARRWKRADILVFNTGHWWVHGKTSRGKNYFKEGDFIYPKFDAVEAFRRALKTWGKWIDKNMNQQQLVFYRGYSSAHFRGGEWDSGGTCHGETDPIKNGRIIETYPPKMKIIEEVIQEMRFPVVLLNVTRLTNFRKDGHPSVYGKNVTGLKKVSTKREDCSHWCLPGVPDAWNEVIYATLAAQTN